MDIIKGNPITLQKIKDDLIEVIDLDYQNMHPRWVRAYSDYEYSLRVLIAFREADEAVSGCSELRTA